jgi:hypothetical protein
MLTTLCAKLLMKLVDELSGCVMELISGAHHKRHCLPRHHTHRPLWPANLQRQYKRLACAYLTEKVRRMLKTSLHTEIKPCPCLRPPQSALDGFGLVVFAELAHHSTGIQ